MRRVYLVMLSAAALLVSCSSAEPQPEFKAVSTTQDVMESLVAHMAQEVWDSVKIEIDDKGAHETRPQNKEEWQEVAYAARGLAEASTLLMFDGRVEDRGDWEKFVKELTETSLVAAKAADDQDFDGLMEAGGNIYEVCTKCHEAYLEKVERKRTGGTGEAPLTPPPGAPAPATAPTTEKK